MLSKKILNETGFDYYENGMSPKELANRTLNKFYQGDLSVEDLPVDPFNILIKSGVKYALLDFKAVDGVYIMPDDSIGVIEKGYVGINKNRPIERVRFSASHELCHHLKDYSSSESKQNSNDPDEIYANDFASNLLAPDYLVTELINEYGIQNIEDHLDDVFLMSLQFGMSFQAMALRVSILLKQRFDNEKFKRLSRKYRPNKQKEKYDISYQHVLYSQVINGYFFEIIEKTPSVKLKNDFLRFVITNDHMIENGKVTEERINEILAIIRVKGLDDISNIITDQNEIEVVGEYMMYHKIFDYDRAEELPDVLVGLHKVFYSCAPYPEAGGVYREATARISGTTVSTTPPYLIGIEIIDAVEKFHKLEQQCITNTDFIGAIVNLHHKLTVIHPFADGNGRTLRAFSNYQFYNYMLTPIFIKLAAKNEYKKGLSYLDELNVLGQRSEYIEIHVFKTMIEMYDYFLKENMEDEIKMNGI